MIHWNHSLIAPGKENKLCIFDGKYCGLLSTNNNNTEKNPEKKVPSWMSSDGQSKTKYRLGLSFTFSHARQRSRFLSISPNMYDFLHAITDLISFVSSPQTSWVCRFTQDTGRYTFPQGSSSVITDRNQLRTIVSSSQWWLKTWKAVYVLCLCRNHGNMVHSWLREPSAPVDVKRWYESKGNTTVLSFRWFYTNEHILSIMFLYFCT